MRTIIIVVISALGATASVPTQAQYYGGLPLTAVRGNLASDLSNLLFGSRFFSSADALQNDGSDLKFGYRFSSHQLPHIALVGKFATSSGWDTQRVLFGESRTAQKTASYGIDLVSTLPIFERLSVNGSAGVARLRADSVFGGAVPIGLINNIDGRYTSAARVGLGVQYDFNRSLGFRFGVERVRNLSGNTYEASNPDADTFAFGVRIRF